MEEQTGETPEALLTKPDFDIIDQWYMDTFFKLSSSRNSGMSIGSIPISEICAYGTFMEHIEETLEDFIEIIMAMDNAFLEYHSKQKPKSNQINNNKK